MTSVSYANSPKNGPSQEFGRLDIRDYDTALDYLDGLDAAVILIVGSGKMFKTGTMFSLLNACPTLGNRLKALYKYPVPEKLLERMFPPWKNSIYKADTLQDVLPESVLIIDDLSRMLGSRGSGANKDLQENQPEISHKSVVEIGTVQNLSNADIALFRDQDLIRIYKYSRADAISFERPEFMKDSLTANYQIARAVNVLKERGQEINQLYLSWIPRFHRLIYLDPPNWYGRAHTHVLRYDLPDEDGDDNVPGVYYVS